MHITYLNNYGEMTGKATSLVMEEIEENPGLLLCAATGSSPAGLYSELADLAGKKKNLFKKLRILKLDEWGGIPENHPASCEYFLQQNLLGPLGIAPERYISFNSSPEDPEAECRRIRYKVETEGPIDVCILGLGANGHMALNEPAPALQAFAHVASLSEESLQHPMIASLEQKPSYGLTLGMQEILSSKLIIMLVSGKGKKEITEKFLDRSVSPELPASFLWQHPHVACLVDSEVLV